MTTKQTHVRKVSFTSNEFSVVSLMRPLDTADIVIYGIIVVIEDHNIQIA